MRSLFFGLVELVLDCPLAMSGTWLEMPSGPGWDRTHPHPHTHTLVSSAYLCFLPFLSLLLVDSPRQAQESADIDAAFEAPLPRDTTGYERANAVLARARAEDKEKEAALPSPTLDEDGVGAYLFHRSSRQGMMASTALRFWTYTLLGIYNLFGYTISSSDSSSVDSSYAIFLFGLPFDFVFSSSSESSGTMLLGFGFIYYMLMDEPTSASSSAGRPRLDDAEEPSESPRGKEGRDSRHLLNTRS
jgi:hypothetical protein